jgi:hypothetical protein
MEVGYKSDGKSHGRVKMFWRFCPTIHGPGLHSEDDRNCRTLLIVFYIRQTDTTKSRPRRR